MLPPRPVTADDLERDRVLEQRIALFKWIEPYHLDIPEGLGREGFLMFAQQGMGSYQPSLIDSRHVTDVRPGRVAEDQPL